MAGPETGLTWAGEPLDADAGQSPEPKGKLDAMTGYSFTTPVWDGGAWVNPSVAGVRVAPAVAEVTVARHVNGPEGVPDWDAINWQVHEGNVRRLRQRISRRRGSRTGRGSGPCRR